MVTDLHDRPFQSILLKLHWKLPNVQKSLKVFPYTIKKTKNSIQFLLFFVEAWAIFSNFILLWWTLI